MFTTSQDYKDTMRLASRPFDKVEGLITLTTGQTVQVSPANMPTNAITINKQCIDGEELMFGGVFLGELELSVITDVSRYAFYGASITLKYSIVIGYDEEESAIYEEIPLGTYQVASADRISNTVKMTAYDNMRLLDKDLGGNVIQGNPWEVFSRVQLETGYQLAFTENDLEDFINYDSQLQYDAEHGISTYREVVKAVCQNLGCFAQDDRYGKLMIKKFSEEPDLTLTTSDWYSLVPADYLCNYVALTVVGLAGTFNVTSSSPNEIGNHMIIEDSPSWDYGTTATLQARAQNLFDYLYDISYTPCDLSMPGDPSFDCGDRLELETRDGDTIETLITSYSWSFHNGMSITSEGSNPYLQGASTDEISSTRMLNQDVEGNKIKFVHFTNEREREILDTHSAVIGNVNFTTTTSDDIIFIATILVEIDVDDVTTTETLEVPVKAYKSDGSETVLQDSSGNTVTLKGVTTSTHTRSGYCNVQVSYQLDRAPIDYVAIDKLTAGKHIISVYYPLTGLTGNTLYNWRVLLTADGGTITVPQFTLKATLMSQGVMSYGGFDGRIEAEDNAPLINVHGISISNLNETVSVSTPNTNSATGSDTISVQDIGKLSLSTLTDTAPTLVLVYNEDYISYCGEGQYCGDDFNTSGENLLGD